MRQLYSRIKKDLCISASVCASVMILAGCAGLQGASEDNLQIVQQQRKIALEPVQGIQEVKEHLAMMLNDDVLIYAENGVQTENEAEPGEDVTQSSESKDENSGSADTNSECANENLEHSNVDAEIDNSEDAEEALTQDEQIVKRMNNIADLKDYNFDSYTSLPVYTKCYYFDERWGAELYEMQTAQDDSEVYVNFEGTWNRTQVNSGMAVKLEISNQDAEGFDVSGYVMDYNSYTRPEYRAYFLRYDLAICEFTPDKGKTGYILFERTADGMNIYATGLLEESEYYDCTITIAGGYTREEPEYINTTRVEDNFTEEELAEIRALLGDDYYEHYFYNVVRYGELDATKVVLGDGTKAIHYVGDYPAMNYWTFELLKCENGDLYCKVCLMSPSFFTNVDGATDLPEYELAKATEQEKAIAKIQSGNGWFDAKLGDVLWNGRPDGPVKDVADFTGEWGRTEVHSGLFATIDISNQDEEGFDVSGGVGYFSHGGMLEDGRAYFITDTMAIYEYNGCYLLLERTKDGMKVYEAEAQGKSFPFGAGCSMEGNYDLGEPEYTNDGYMEENFTQSEQNEIKALLGDAYDMNFEDVVNYGVVDSWTCELEDGTKAVYYDGWFPTLAFCNFRMLKCENGDLYCEVGNENDWYTNVAGETDLPEYRIVWY